MIRKKQQHYKIAMMIRDIFGFNTPECCGSILVLKNLKTSNNMTKIGKYEHII